MATAHMCEPSACPNETNWWLPATFTSLLVDAILLPLPSSPNMLMPAPAHSRVLAPSTTDARVHCCACRQPGSGLPCMFEEVRKAHSRCSAQNRLPPSNAHSPMHHASPAASRTQVSAYPALTATNLRPLPASVGVFVLPVVSSSPLAGAAPQQ